jgi:uncharacterized UBP type Zn finger protein
MRRARRPWPVLRLCLTCGHVGCCDKTRNQHALKHVQATGHPLVRPYKERGMHWVWCYLDWVSARNADTQVLSPRCLARRVP